MKLSAKKLSKQRRNQAMYSKYITLTNEGIVHQIFYLKEGASPKDVDSFYKIPRELKVEIGDKVEISESEIKVIREKE